MALPVSAVGASNYCVGLFSEARSNAALRIQEKELPYTKRKQLTVGTWNMNYFFVAKPMPLTRPDVIQRTPNNNNSINRSREDVFRARKVLEDIDADVFVLTEVVGNYSSKALDPKGIYHHIIGNNAHHGEYLTVFLVRKTLNLSTRVYRNKKIEDQARIHRGLPVLALVAPGQTDPSLLLMGIHLKSKVSLEEEVFQKIKRREIHWLNEARKDLAKKYPQATFMVAGDFNLNIMRNPSIKIFQNHLVESMSAANKSDGVLFRTTQTYHIRGSREVVAKQLDGIFIDAHMKDQVFSSHVYRYKFGGKELQFADEKGNYWPYPQTLEDRILLPSDHFPVVMSYWLDKQTPQ